MSQKLLVPTATAATSTNKESEADPTESGSSAHHPGITHLTQLQGIIDQIRALSTAIEFQSTGDPTDLRRQRDRAVARARLHIRKLGGSDGSSFTVPDEPVAERLSDLETTVRNSLDDLSKLLRGPDLALPDDRPGDTVTELNKSFQQCLDALEAVRVKVVDDERPSRWGSGHWQRWRKIGSEIIRTKDDASAVVSLQRSKWIK